MSRGLVVALIGEPLIGARDAYRIPNATNGVVFVYDVLGVERLQPSPNIDVFAGQEARKNAIQAHPWLRHWLINVFVTTNDPDPLKSPTRLCQPGAMRAGETCQVLDAGQVQRTRTKAQLVAGDRPVAGQWSPVHEWAGLANDLGEDE